MQLRLSIFSKETALEYTHSEKSRVSSTDFFHFNEPHLIQLMMRLRLQTSFLSTLFFTLSGCLGKEEDWDAVGWLMSRF